MTLTAAQRRTVAWLGIAAAALLLLWLLAPVLLPFLLAAVLAYALHPAVEWLVARRLPRLLAVLLLEAAAILAVLGLLLLMVPILSKELPLLREQIPVLAARLNEVLAPWLAQHGVNLSLDIASIKAFVVKYLNANLEDWLSTALSSARIGGSFVLAIAGHAVLVPVVLFYLLMDWPEVVRRTLQFVPPRFEAGVTGFLAECDEVLGQYLRGQLLVMVILAAYYSVGLALFGFDLAVPVGVFTGLAIFIPYLGFGLGMVLALLAGVLQFASWYGVIGVAVVYGIGQLVESFYLTPRLVGERIGMHPITVIFALLAFGHLLGFVGVLIALPVSALLVVAVRRLRRTYLESRLYLG
ncbi:AI-2E family transporter [Caldimonas thermodepolymerans]|uniref:PurR-regulated permease PerM n=1 Tax=Caldimonas thermodepolymerans TaxID=215580 RepID=A0AA46DDK5_9BURK|nr:AI-2E family transporter [Caldimonas thermodepolymerans]TCP06653.1 putative PurR-regulated permease PerM [Caldimonas thermodepolymerans]UZG49291.1 AI-2E family transporter [Caldimonas thermodepolymerans]